MTSPFKFMFDSQHVLTPFAVDKYRVRTSAGYILYKYVYVFGIRVAAFNAS